MKTKNLFALALTLAAVAFACKKTVPLSEETSEIRFRMAQSPISVSTKAQAVTSLSSFQVTATTGITGSEVPAWENVTFSGWEIFTGGKHWPETNPGFHFYAANSPISLLHGEALLPASSQTDIVAAYLNDPAYKTVNNLDFLHIFARLRNVSVAIEPGYTMQDVSIRLTPKTSGTFHIATGYGQDAGTGWSDAIDGDVLELTNTNGGNKSLDAYMIPGEYVISATWTAVKGDLSITHTNKRYVAQLTGGKENDLSVTLFGEKPDDGEAQFSVSLQQWGTAERTAQYSPDIFNGHDYIDLGLRDSLGRKVLFATKNLGAENEYDYGDRYAWGERERRYTLSADGASLTSGSFNWNSYIFSNGAENKLTRYCTDENYSADGYVDGLSVLCDTDDPVMLQWGGKWQTPDAEHLKLLLNWTLVWNGWSFDYMESGIQGRMFKGRGDFAGTTLFLPAGGHLEENAVLDLGSNLEYWSRQLGGETPDKASYLKMTGTFGKVYEEEGERFKGRCIRPVIVVDD